MEFLSEHAMETLELLSSVLQDRYGMSVRDSLKEMIPFVTGLMNPLYNSIDPLTMGEHRRVLAIGEEYGKRLLERDDDPQRAADIIHRLVWEYPSHEFVIDIQEAQAIRLPVEPLDVEQEKRLIASISELGSHDLSFAGFVPDDSGGKTPDKPQKRSMRRSIDNSKTTGHVNGAPQKATSPNPKNHSPRSIS